MRKTPRTIIISGLIAFFAAGIAEAGFDTMLKGLVEGTSTSEAGSVASTALSNTEVAVRRTSEAQLTERFLPIVKQATNKTGVTAAYKSVTDQAGGMLGGFMGGSDALDLDAYVTKGALDGLFKYIALEEKSIRTNPLARSTDLLKKVFGG